MSQRPSAIESERDFEAAVLASPGLVLAVFWADWSGTCHLMMPVVEAVARELAGRVEVVLVDADRVPGLKSRYAVECVPAFLFFLGGRLVERIFGTIPRKTLVEKAGSLLA